MYALIGILRIYTHIVKNIPSLPELTKEKSFQDNSISSDLLLYAIGDAVISTDNDFNITGLNPAAEKIYQVEASEVMGKKVNSVFKYDYINDTPENALKELNKKGYWKGEVLYKTKENKYIHLLATVKYITDKQGKKIGVVAVNKDITDISGHRKDLRSAELTTNIILENCGNAIFLMDSRYNVIMYNSLAYDLMKDFVKATIAPSANLVQILPSFRRDHVFEKLELVKAGNRVEYDVQYPSGRWLHIIFTPIMQQDGSIYNICTCMNDVTERKKEEERKLKLQIEIQKQIMQATVKGQEKQSDKIGKELHDNINQVLTAVKLQLSMVEQNGCPHHDIIKKAGLNLNRVINEIRKLSKDLVSPGFTDESLTDELERLVHQYSPCFQVQLQVEDFNEELTTDPVKLSIYRIIQEQLTNVLKHSNASKVLIELTSNEQITTLRVEDNGRGTEISKARSGIGLTNIRNRVASLNGHTQIETAQGKGFKLTAEFPV